MVIHERATSTLLPKFSFFPQDGCISAEPFFFPAVVPHTELLNSHSSGSLHAARPTAPGPRTQR